MPCAPLAAGPRSIVTKLRVHATTTHTRARTSGAHSTTAIAPSIPCRAAVAVARRSPSRGRPRSRRRRRPARALLPARGGAPLLDAAAAGAPVDAGGRFDRAEIGEAQSADAAAPPRRVRRRGGAELRVREDRRRRRRASRLDREDDLLPLEEVLRRDEELPRRASNGPLSLSS